MDLPQHGRDTQSILADLTAKRVDDVRWQDGRTFGLVFDGGPDVHEVAERAATAFLHENALNMRAFPSLAAIQSEVVGWTSGLLHGPDSAAGFLTSGGTESIQCAVLAARERGRAERDVRRGEIVVAESAHAAFHKSAHLYDMPIHTAPVLDDWTADVEAMRELVNERTVLVVGSAPQFPQGVVDPIPAIAQLAASVDANCHVDACMGGFVLPFVEMLGRDVPPWDFRVPGVHSVSADVHKLGYAPKGASVILYRSKHLRRFQTWIFDGWLGGMYGSPNLQGSRSGLPMAAAWAVMQHLGVDGYVELTSRTLDCADRIRDAVTATDGIRLLGDGRFHLIAIASDPTSDHPVDVFALHDALTRQGWYLDRQGPPDSIHLTVSNGNAATVEEFLGDLRTCVEAVRDATTDDRSTSYSTVD
jgi:sphinganine-1-phosphate aldolase